MICMVNDYQLFLEIYINTDELLCIPISCVYNNCFVLAYFEH